MNNILPPPLFNSSTTTPLTPAQSYYSNLAISGLAKIGATILSNYVVLRLRGNSLAAINYAKLDIACFAALTLIDTAEKIRQYVNGQSEPNGIGSEARSYAIIGMVLLEKALGILPNLGLVCVDLGMYVINILVLEKALNDIYDCALKAMGFSRH
ncbi:MAG: hypothetical protein Tsb0021_08350 [Chlamydiales bacterium]